MAVSELKRKCGEICARSTRTSASALRARVRSNSARSSWPEVNAATSSTARINAGPAEASEYATSAPMTTSSEVSGAAIPERSISETCLAWSAGMTTAVPESSAARACSAASSRCLSPMPSHARALNRSVMAKEWDAQQPTQMLHRSPGRGLCEPSAQCRSRQAGDVQRAVGGHLPLGTHPGTAAHPPGDEYPQHDRPGDGGQRQQPGIHGCEPSGRSQAQGTGRTPDRYCRYRHARLRLPQPMPGVSMYRSLAPDRSRNRTRPGGHPRPSQARPDPRLRGHRQGRPDPRHRPDPGPGRTQGAAAATRRRPLGDCRTDTHQAGQGCGHPTCPLAGGHRGPAPAVGAEPCAGRTAVRTHPAAAPSRARRSPSRRRCGSSCRTSTR